MAMAPAPRLFAEAKEHWTIIARNAAAKTVCTRRQANTPCANAAGTRAGRRLQLMSVISRAMRGSSTSSSPCQYRIAMTVPLVPCGLERGPMHQFATQIQRFASGAV